jgi:hypothetical protein
MVYKRQHHAVVRCTVDSAYIYEYEKEGTMAPATATPSNGLGGISKTHIKDIGEAREITRELMHVFVDMTMGLCPANGGSKDECHDCRTPRCIAPTGRPHAPQYPAYVEARLARLKHLLTASVAPE